VTTVPPTTVPATTVPATTAPAHPPLPKRQPQASQVQRPLDDTAAPATGIPRDHATRTTGAEQPAEQLTGLMANFLSGVSRAESEEEDNDSPAGD
jgi:hypothetical protein